MTTNTTSTEAIGAEQAFDIELSVNDGARTVHVPARRLLSDCLRHDLGLTGTHVGCEQGVCGACTVQIDGTPMRSCLMFAISAQGHQITTAEGWAERDGTMHAMQRALQECHGLQCGFCTPGLLAVIEAFLRDNPDPTELDATRAIVGNLCRCTGYQNIVKAILRAAAMLRAERAVEVSTP